jgi:hypothetical protein
VEVHRGTVMLHSSELLWNVVKMPQYTASHAGRQCSSQSQPLRTSGR